MRVNLSLETKINLNGLFVPRNAWGYVHVGPVRKEIVEHLRSSGFDQAPVLSEKREVIGLIDTASLQELRAKDSQLLESDERIKSDCVEETTDLGLLLDTMSQKKAVLVVRKGARNPKSSIGLLTLSDLNRHPFRTVIYGMLAELESKLAKLVEGHFKEDWDWLKHLSEDHQASLLGYWELAKRNNLDIGPIAGTTLTQLFNIIGADASLRESLGYTSKSQYDKVKSPIPDLRNRVMHPVRPLISSSSDLSQLKETIGNIIELAQRIHSRESYPKVAASVARA